MILEPHGRAHGFLLNMAESIREVIASAVSDALNRSQASASNSSTSHQDPDNGRGKKRKPKILPSSFLKKKKGKQAVQQVWDKDIICLPKDHVSNAQDIPIPRGRTRVELAKMGLVGKIRLNSEMEEDDIREEICSAFSKPMAQSTTFSFEVRTRLLYCWRACTSYCIEEVYISTRYGLTLL